MSRKYLSSFISNKFVGVIVLLLALQSLPALAMGANSYDKLYDNIHDNIYRQPSSAKPVIAPSFNLLAANTEDPVADALGLWVQNEPINLEGKGYNCGCHVLGLSFAPPRRCYFYFTRNRVVSGYLTAASGLSKDKCAKPAIWTDEQKAKMLKKLAEVAANKKPGSSNIGRGFTYAVGKLNIIKAAAPTSIDGTKLTGTYYDITFPKPLLTGHSRICSAYLLKDESLYIAKDPLGGSKPQDKDATICDSQRFTQLTEFTRIK